MRENKFYRTYTLTNEISEILRERVLKGQYQIGEKIKENQIATELKVSRTPIREAFKQLEREGLLEIVPNKGCYAKGFSNRDLQDIYSVRKSLEQLAMEWAVERISEDDIEKVRQEYELMRIYTESKDRKKVYEANKNFHEIIYGATGSRFLVHILKSYQEYVHQTRKATVFEEKNLDTILQEHKEIYIALKNKDKTRAIEKIGIHLDNSRKRAEEAWGMQNEE